MSSNNHRKVSVTRLAYKLSPPELCIEYMDTDISGMRQKYHKRIEIREFNEMTDIEKLTSVIISRYNRLLANNVTPTQIQGILAKMQHKYAETMHHKDFEPAVATAEADATPSPHENKSSGSKQTSLGVGDGDLQKVSEEQLKAAKQVMDVAFQAARLRPGEPGYEYDRRVEFEADDDSNSWDD